MNLKFKDIKRYHISTFTTNLLALVLAIFFIRSYIQRGISILPIFLIMVALIAALLLLSIFILKPLGKVKRVLPSRNFLILNIAIALIIDLIFLSQIGFTGFCFVLLFAFFLFEAEHTFHESVKR